MTGAQICHAVTLPNIPDIDVDTMLYINRLMNFSMWCGSDRQLVDHCPAVYLPLWLLSCLDYSSWQEWPEDECDLKEPCEVIVCHLETYFGNFASQQGNNQWKCTTSTKEIWLVDCPVCSFSKTLSFLHFLFSRSEYYCVKCWKSWWL